MLRVYDESQSTQPAGRNPGELDREFKPILTPATVPLIERLAALPE